MLNKTRTGAVVWVFSVALLGCASSDDSSKPMGQAQEADAAVATDTTAGGSGGSKAMVSAGSAGKAAPADTSALDTSKPFKPTGDAITAPDKQWQWIEFADSKCRDGSAAGIAVNLNSASQKLMIFLEGGGACFDAQTCSSNPPKVGNKMPNAVGVFDRAKMENPVRDWNFAYVPYCSGDVHMGEAEDVTVAGVTGPQQFLGRRNLQAFLNRLVPTFAKAEQVLLTGVSAGGFGASANNEFVQWAFGSVPVTMIDDSGPAFSNMFLPKCLTDLYRKYWGIDNTILKLCGSDCPPDGDYSFDYIKHLAKVSSKSHAGLIESNQDQVIRWFYGIGTNNGANDCKGALAITPMDGMLFEQGLLEYRSLIKERFSNFATYLPKSTTHTWISSAAFYTASFGEPPVKMVDWFRDVLDGKPPAHVGP